MKFLLLTQYFPPEIGAVPVRLAAVARELGSRGHEVEVVTAMPNHPHGRIAPEYAGSLLKHETWEGIPVHRVWLHASTGAGFSRMINYASFAVMAFLGLLSARKPDFLLVESPPTTVAIPAILAAKLWGSRVILNVADLWPDSISAMNLSSNRLLVRALGVLERWMYRHADFISAITVGVKNTLEFVKKVPKEKILYLPNGVDASLFRPIPPDLELKSILGLPENVFLYAGTLGFAHGLETLIEAANLLRDRPDAHFLFIGDGSERARLESMKAEMKLSNVTFRDAVPAAELARYASFCTAAIVPQRDLPLFRGNRPAKLFAMMGCGKPVVFCGRGEAASLIETAKSGVVVAPENPAALASALRDLLNDPGAVRAFSDNGRRYVETRYSWSMLLNVWLIDLESRCESRRVQPARPHRAGAATISRESI